MTCFLCLQQLSDKGGFLDSEEAIAEQQEADEERNGPPIVTTPVQLRCTLEVHNRGMYLTFPAAVTRSPIQYLQATKALLACTDQLLLVRSTTYNRHKEESVR